MEFIASWREISIKQTKKVNERIITQCNTYTVKERSKVFDREQQDMVKEGLLVQVAHSENLNLTSFLLEPQK